MPAHQMPSKAHARPRVSWANRWPVLLAAARNPDWLLRVAALSAHEAGLRNALRRQGESEEVVLATAEAWVRAAMVQADEERRRLHALVPVRFVAPFQTPMEGTPDADQDDDA